MSTKYHDLPPLSPRGRNVSVKAALASASKGRPSSSNACASPLSAAHSTASTSASASGRRSAGSVSDAVAGRTSAGASTDASCGATSTGSTRRGSCLQDATPSGAVAVAPGLDKENDAATTALFGSGGDASPDELMSPAIAAALASQNSARPSMFASHIAAAQHSAMTISSTSGCGGGGGGGADGTRASRSSRGSGTAGGASASSSSSSRSSGYGGGGGGSGAGNAGAGISSCAVAAPLSPSSRLSTVPGWSSAHRAESLEFGLPRRSASAALIDANIARALEFSARDVSTDRRGLAATMTTRECVLLGLVVALVAVLLGLALRP